MLEEEQAIAVTVAAKAQSGTMVSKEEAEATGQLEPYLDDLVKTLEIRPYGKCCCFITPFAVFVVVDVESSIAPVHAMGRV